MGDVSRWYMSQGVNIHTNNSHNSASKNNLTLMKFCLCDNMDGPSGYYARWNKSGQRRANIVWYHMKSKKQNRKRLTDTENKWWMDGARKEGVWEEKEV